MTITKESKTDETESNEGEVTGVLKLTKAEKRGKLKMKEAKKQSKEEVPRSPRAPQAEVLSLQEMLEVSKDGDGVIAILALKSLLAVFKNIIPRYRIRLPTEKEQEMKVSKAIKKMRFYESTLLSALKYHTLTFVSAC
ncbi:nucleolar complex-associated protein 3-like isoform X2 [Primulina huaijiensis]|uniref:nucleolar complex-associated protein 3-like isoform X2 n=1 Tax=Primulina huaijiensis TaxID=1492673 RepID=UPI003CC797E9